MSAQATLAQFLPEYLSDLTVRGYSRETLRVRGDQLRIFLEYCQERSATEPSAITLAFVERYARHESSRISAQTGRRLAATTAIHRLSTLKSFLGFLVKRQAMLFNPALELQFPRTGKHLPRGVLTAREVEHMMLVPDILTPCGLRNRALLELLYSTGMRRSEVCKLNLEDMDFGGGSVFIRQAKGHRDRITPVGKRALFWLQKYLEEARPAMSDSADAALFLARRTGRITPAQVSFVVRTAREACGIKKPGAAHILRHTAATLMLENGADVRYVQQFLGHEALSSTQRYTHVAIPALKAVHAKTHPANYPERDP